MIKWPILMFKLLFSISLFSQEQTNHKNFDYIFVDIIENGEKRKYLFDNGFEKSAIILSKRYNLRADSIKVIDLSGNEDHVLVSKNKIKLEIPNSDACKKLKLYFFEDLPDYFLDKNISGVLGNDFIGDYNWEVDFDKKSARIIDKKTLKNINKNKYFHIKKLGNEMVRGYFFQPEDHFDTLLFKVDLGFSGIVSVKNDIKNNTPFFTKKGISSSAISETIEESKVIQNRLILGSMIIDSLPIVINDTASIYNLVGNKFLASFKKLIIDNKYNILYLKKIDKNTFDFTNPVIYDGKVVSTLIGKYGKTDLHEWKINEVINPEDIESHTLELNSYFYEYKKRSD